MGRIVLCADTESLVRPMLIGLQDVRLDGREWLVSIADAAEAREFVSSASDVDEAWVVSSDDLVGINLAAAIRKDNPELPVYLIAFDPSGSELSRAAQAGVTETLTAASFCARFDAEARRRSLMSEIEQMDVDAMMEECHEAQIDVQGEGSCVQEEQSYVQEARIGDDGIKAPSEVAPVLRRSPVTASCPLSREGNAFVLSFLSGSGGVGKSTVASLSACLAAARGFRVVAVDCDMQFGDLGQVMGVDAGMSIDDVLADAVAIDRLAEETSDGMPACLLAPSRLERSEDLAGRVDSLIDICATAFDVVVVNTGASWSECHAHLLERSSVSVFMIDQRASSVHGCKHALDLCMRLGIASNSFVYALNRCKRGALFSAIDIANVLQGAHVLEIRDGGGEVEELMGAGLALELAASKNELCVSVDEMLDELLPSVGSLSASNRFRSGVPRRGKSRRSAPIEHGSPRARMSGAKRKSKKRAAT